MERNLTVVPYSHILIIETEFLQKELSYSSYFLFFRSHKWDVCISLRYFRPCIESACFRCTIYYLPLNMLGFHFPHDVASNFY
jgi:hypothetical protein